MEFVKLGNVFVNPMNVTHVTAKRGGETGVHFNGGDSITVRSSRTSQIVVALEESINKSAGKSLFSR